MNVWPLNLVWAKENSECVHVDHSNEVLFASFLQKLPGISCVQGSVQNIWINCKYVEQLIIIAEYKSGVSANFLIKLITLHYYVGRLMWVDAAVIRVAGTKPDERHELIDLECWLWINVSVGVKQASVVTKVEIEHKVWDSWAVLRHASTGGWRGSDKCSWPKRGTVYYWVSIKGLTVVVVGLLGV